MLLSMLVAFLIRRKASTIPSYALHQDYGDGIQYDHYCFSRVAK